LDGGVVFFGGWGISVCVGGWGGGGGGGGGAELHREGKHVLTLNGGLQ